MLTFHIIGHTSNFWRCRSASVSATAAVRSIAVEDENVDSASSEDSKKLGMNEVADSSNDDESIQGKGKGRKRAAARGRGRGATPSKRGRKSENSALQRMLMNKDDDDDDDDDDVTKRLNKSQPRVTRNYGALRR